MSTVEIRTPLRLRGSRPLTTPSARTKKDPQQLSRAEEFGQLIQTWLAAAAAVIIAGMVTPG
ncbi:hypothetical protein FAIPA1_10184 [Frankia sp. AiPs1]